MEIQSLIETISIFLNQIKWCYGIPIGSQDIVVFDIVQKTIRVLIARFRRRCYREIWTSFTELKTSHPHSIGVKFHFQIQNALFLDTCNVCWFPYLLSGGRHVENACNDTTCRNVVCIRLELIGDWTVCSLPRQYGVTEIVLFLEYRRPMFWIKGIMLCMRKWSFLYYFLLKDHYHQLIIAILELIYFLLW